MTHSADTSAVRHVIAQHGDEAKEVARGQLPVRDVDLRAVPAVLLAPDRVVLGLTNSRGQAQIAYVKELADGTTLYIEEVRVGRKKLALASMRRFPGTINATRLTATLDPHARSASRGGPNIIDVPAGIKATEPRSLDQTFDSGARGRVAFDGEKRVIELFQAADLSTFTHEAGHIWLEELREDAEAEGAADQVKADWEAAKAWFAANGHALDADGAIPTEAHELWARGVERFVMEGKAPSPALASVFDRLRAWLLSIYQVVSNLRSPITPEIREVMGRLLAVDQEIADARQAGNVRALFENAKQAGMTAAEFKAYQAATSDARDEAFNALLYRTMETIRRRRKAAWQEEEKGVRAHVTEQVDARPEFRALRALRAAAPRLKLDGAWLVERYGEDALALLPRSVPPIYADRETTDADSIAELHGFNDGDDMVQALMGVELRSRQLREANDKRSARQSVIDEETAAAMAERHGDPLADGSIEEEALAAISNDKQGEVIASDLRALSRQLKDGPPTPYKLARQWAARKVASGTVSRPISTKLNVIHRHLGEVIHDITHREAIINADRFLSDRRLMEAVDRHLGREYRQEFRPWLKHVANSWAMDRTGAEGVTAFMTKMRANATVVGMGFRFTTMITQVVGYSDSFERVGVRWVAPAIARFAGQVAGKSVKMVTFQGVEMPPMMAFVLERSGEVRSRLDTLDRDIGSAIKLLAGKYDLAANATRFAFHGIGYMDRLVSVPTWIGAYEKALSEGTDEAAAINAGDEAVRTSQGAAAAKDLASVQRDKRLILFTMFYSYMSHYYQRVRTLGRDAGEAARERNVQALPRLLARAWWLMVVPSILTELLSGRGPDDDEDWGWWATKRILLGVLGPLPLVRDVTEPFWDAITGGKPRDYQLSPLQRAGQSLVVAGGDAHRLATGEETKHATKDVLEATGYVTGLVPGQVASATQFLVDVGQGDADPHGVADWYKGLTTGRLK